MNIILFAFSIRANEYKFEDNRKQYFMHSPVYPMFQKICFNSKPHSDYILFAFSQHVNLISKFVSNHIVLLYRVFLMHG